MASRSPVSRRASRCRCRAAARPRGLRARAATRPSGSAGPARASSSSRSMSSGVDRLQAVRPVAGEQHVQQHAQRVDVGGGGAGAAAELLGAGVVGRHQPGGGRGGLVRRRRRRRATSLATPKSSSFGVPSRVTRMLSGLMSRWTTRFSCAYCTPAQTVRNSCEPLVDRQPLLVAVAIDRHALDELHHEVRLAVGGRAAVQQPRDVRMIQRGQRLALGLEPAHDAVGIRPRPDHLQRRLPPERGIGALGAIHHAHAARAHKRIHAPGADRRADEVHMAGGCQAKALRGVRPAPRESRWTGRATPAATAPRRAARCRPAQADATNASRCSRGRSSASEKIRLASAQDEDSLTDVPPGDG